MLVALTMLTLPAGSVGPIFQTYFDQEPPGDTPAVFAPAIISLDDRFEQFLVYAPDGNEILFGVTNGHWSAFSLFAVRREGDRWGTPVPALFVGDNPIALTAAASYTSSTVFFTSGRVAAPPVGVWMSTRRGAEWSEATMLGPPISTDANEFEVAVARNGTLYFSSSRVGGEGDLDIYRAPLINGAYPEAHNLGPPINTPSGDDLPFIAPDESYLIFGSNRPGGLGNRDLYISFRIGGAWSQPENLGAPINTALWDIYPSVSPDGQYMFFARRTEWAATEDSDIYWVSTAFVERMRRTARRR